MEQGDLDRYIERTRRDNANGIRLDLDGHILALADQRDAALAEVEKLTAERGLVERIADHLAEVAREQTDAAKYGLDTAHEVAANASVIAFEVATADIRLRQTELERDELQRAARVLRHIVDGMQICDAAYQQSRDLQAKAAEHDAEVTRIALACPDCAALKQRALNAEAALDAIIAALHPLCSDSCRRDIDGAVLVAWNVALECRIAGREKEAGDGE